MTPLQDATCTAGTLHVVRVNQNRKEVTDAFSATQPSPLRWGATRRTGLQRWLTGIAWRQASHYRDRACNRYEIPFGRPGQLVAGEVPSLDAQVAAREALRIALPELPPECLEVVALSAAGATIAEIAEELGIPEGTAASRRRRGRERFAQSLRRWRR
jgi:RNA polymerase sigma-70 factor (ECF subfamily)